MHYGPVADALNKRFIIPKLMNVFPECYSWVKKKYLHATLLFSGGVFSYFLSLGGCGLALSLPVMLSHVLLQWH